MFPAIVIKLSSAKLSTARTLAHRQQTQLPILTRFVQCLHFFILASYSSISSFCHCNISASRICIAITHKSQSQSRPQSLTAAAVVHLRYDCCRCPLTREFLLLLLFLPFFLFHFSCTFCSYVAISWTPLFTCLLSLMMAARSSTTSVATV